MKKGQNAFKFFLPLLAVVYYFISVALIVEVSSIFSGHWYYYMAEALLYIIVIGITYFLTKRLYSKFRDGSSFYLIGKADLLSVFGILLCVFALYIAEHQILCGIYILRQGTIIPAQDMETIPEILVLSVSSVFLAPVLEELTFRYCLSAYKSTHGKIIALLCISVIFGFLHTNNPYPALINGFVFGIFFLKTKKLIVPILMHISMNAYTSLFCILYDIGVTGIEINDDPSLWHFNNYWLAAAVLAAIPGAVLLSRTKENKECRDSADN